MAEAEQPSVHLGLAGQRRENRKPFYLVPCARNLLDPQAEAQELRLGDGRLLTDDHAPVDTMVFPVVE